MEQLRIDLVPMGVTPNAHASQFDVGRVIRFLLYNGGTAYTLAGTETITVKMAKPDGTEETVSVTNTSSNYVDFVTTDGLLNLAGLYPCEISITSGTDVIGSKNFNLRVELDPYDGHNIRTVTVGPADICTFTTDLPEFLPSVTVNVVATGGYDADTQTAHPINGYSSANITRCGVNLWDEQTALGILESDGSISPSTVRLVTKNYIPIVGGLTYTMHIPYANRGRGAFYDENKNLISYFGDFPQTGTEAVFPNNGSLYPTGNGYYFTFVAPSNARYVKYNMVAAYGTTYNNDISINYPSTDTTYHAYTGNTYAIAFGQTVYGGVLDVTRGKLTVTHQIVDLGTLSWYNGSTDTENVYRKVALLSDTIILPTSTTVADLLCTNYSAVSPLDTYRKNEGISLNNNSAQVTIYDSNYNTSSDLSAFTEYISGAKLVYPLATPFDIDLTPVQIRALVGENNVFADCGETEVEYLTEGT